MLLYFILDDYLESSTLLMLAFAAKMEIEVADPTLLTKAPHIKNVFLETLKVKGRDSLAKKKKERP